MGMKSGILLALCVLLAVGKYDCTPQDVHLLSLTTETSGTAVIAVAGQNRSYITNYPFTTRSVQVSPACSTSGRSSRCQKLLITSTGQIHIVVAPLQDAVGLMELRYDGRELLKVRDFTLSITPEFFVDNCIPLDIISYDSIRIVLCLENLLVLKSCSINIDEAAIFRSTLSNCVHLHTFASPAEYRYISNFVSSGDQVLFAANGIIYGIRFDRYDVQLYSSLNDVSCDRLEYAGNHMFYAYCASGQTLVYNTDTLLVENVGVYIPFPCPRSEETLFEVQQTDRGTVVRYNNRINFMTTGLNFTIGECYNRDTLFLVDSLEGTKVFQIRQSSGSFHPISNSSRDRNLVVFDGPYLVLHRTDPPEVVLYDPTFQSIVNLHGVAMATGILTDLRKQPIPTTVPTVSPRTTLPSENPPTKESSLGAGEWVGIALGLAVAVLILVLILICVPVILRKKFGEWMKNGICMLDCDRDDLTESDLESQHELTSEPHSPKSPHELRSHSPESQQEFTPESHSPNELTLEPHSSESQREPTLEPHNSESQREPTLEPYSLETHSPELTFIIQSPTASPPHSFQENATPHSASSSSQAPGLVSESYPPIPVTHLTPQLVKDKYDQRTDTDDKHNDERCKMRFLQ